MAPLRLFRSLYFVASAVTVLVGFLAPQYVRWSMVAVGLLLATYGVCLLTNLFNFASETASKAETSRWSPPAFADVRIVRASGALFLVVGILFAVQDLLADNL